MEDLVEAEQYTHSAGTEHVEKCEGDMQLDGGLIGVARKLRNTDTETRTNPSTTMVADHAIPLNDSDQKCDTMPMVPSVKNAQAQ